MKHALTHFFKRHGDLSRPILLGLSGGPDSLALFSLLLHYRKTHPLKLSVAHIDHQWRVESASEARLLETMVTAEGLPFYLKTLDPNALTGNMEDACRRERLRFFHCLCQEHGYQAVMLGHHADDQAETILKRLFEGASGPNLSGLREISTVENVILWRPLLPYTKQQLLLWLEQHNLKGFDDRTNFDTRYLRGRMRTRLLPLLAHEFGKQVSRSLAHVGAEAAQLGDYLDGKLENVINSMEEGTNGFFLDLHSHQSLHPYEIKYVIQQLCEKMDCCLSRAQLETAVRLVRTLVADKQVETGPATLYIDRGHLFLSKRKMQPLDKRYVLEEGMLPGSDWQVRIERLDRRSREDRPSGWKNIWRGSCSVCLPEGDYEVGPAVMNASFPGRSSIAKWWTDAKVPAFLRRWVPVIWQEGEIRHEFLTAKERQINHEGPWIKVILTQRRREDAEGL